jgi:bacterioferritin
MNKSEVIQKLNRAIALELAGVIQYNQYSAVLMGPDRRVWHELFEDMSKGALEHARKFAIRVVALGGTPTIEHAPVKQAGDITTMLTNALELERSLVHAYTEALELSRDNPAYRNLIEEQVWHEHEEVEELEIYLNKVQKAAGAEAKRSGKAAS